MIVRLRKSLIHQLIFLSVAAGLAYLLGSVLGFHPRLRWSTSMVLRGFAFGLLCFAASFILQSLLAFFFKQFRKTLLEVSDSQKDMSYFALSGTAITAGAGEELLFRGVLFTWLASFGLVWGVIGNFLLMFIVHLQGRSFLLWSLSKSFECTFYAIAFHIHRGLTVVAIAHAVVEIASALLLRDKRIRALLSRGSVNETAVWR